MRVGGIGRMRRLIAVGAVATMVGVLTATSVTAAPGLTIGQFKARLAAAQAPWTTWKGPTSPVTPPKQFNLAIVTCLSLLHGCVSPGLGAQHAAKALGWKSTIFDGKGDPTVQAKAIEQAITDHANAIITVAVDGRLVKGALAQAKAAGIPVISTSNGSAPGEQGYTFDTSPNLHKIGAAMADWMVVDTAGKGPIAPYLDKEFQSNIAMTEGVMGELKLCSTCKIFPTQLYTAAQLANSFGPNVVSFLRKNPTVKYITTTYDPSAAVVVPAIAAAGLHTKVISQLGDSQNIEFIRQGKVQNGDGAWDNEYEGWATVDQIIRLVTHKPLWVSAGPARYKYGENIPYVMLTKSNLPAKGKDWTASMDYISKFKALWGLKK
jgi:ribose transport system substrate-binding protein